MNKFKKLLILLVIGSILLTGIYLVSASVTEPYSFDYAVSFPFLNITFIIFVFCQPYFKLFS